MQIPEYVIATGSRRAMSSIKHTASAEEPPFEPYESLGVSRTATADEIKSAYRKLALRCVLNDGPLKHYVLAIRFFSQGINTAPDNVLILYSENETMHD